MQIERYVVVNAINNMPIRRPGFCSIFNNESDAKRTCENWNKMAHANNLCAAKVRTVIR